MLAYLRSKSSLILYTHGICLFFILLPLLSSAQNVIDLYRTKQLTPTQIESLLRKEIDALHALNEKKNDNNFFEKYQKESESVFIEMYRKIRASGNFSYVKVSPIFYQDGSLQITIDVVDSDDNSRLDFIREKTKSNAVVKVDHNVLEKFKKFEKIGSKVFFYHRAKNMRNIATGQKYFEKECKALHCLFELYNYQMDELEKQFFKYVPLVKGQLVEMINNDSNPDNRTDAIYLLAYCNDPQFVIDAIAPALTDSNGSVRNAAARTISFIVYNFEPKHFPLGLVERMLDGPEETDRNKALAVMNSLVKYDKYRNQVNKKTLPILITLLKSHQQNINGFAFNILKELSHENFKQNDFQSWENWLKEQG